MISRNNNKNFFAAHWDWLVAGGGVLALLCALVAMFMSFGVDPDFAANEELASLGTSSKKVAIESIDMKDYDLAMKALVSPATLAEPAETMGGFLASDRRVFCEQGDPAATEKACGLPIVFGLKVCPFCKAKQPVEVKVVLDTDGDGIPDEQEKKFGMNPNDASDADADMDGDGFTNIEEYLAKTDLTDRNSHPDYLDSLSLVAPLKETFLPFYFEKARPTPSGIKFDFKDPNKKNNFGTKGRPYSVYADEQIGNTGFVAKKFEKKFQKKKIEGAKHEKEVDVSTATIERISDHKTIVLTIDKRCVALDVQATLVFERNGRKEFVVVPGDTIDLYGSKYRISSITRDGKKAKVVVEDAVGTKRVLEALEP